MSEAKKMNLIKEGAKVAVIYETKKDDTIESSLSNNIITSEPSSSYDSTIRTEINNTLDEIMILQTGISDLEELDLTIKQKRKVAVMAGLTSQNDKLNDDDSYAY